MNMLKFFHSILKYCAVFTVPITGLQYIFGKQLNRLQIIRLCNDGRKLVISGGRDLAFYFVAGLASG